MPKESMDCGLLWDLKSFGIQLASLISFFLVFLGILPPSLLFQLLVAIRKANIESLRTASLGYRKGCKLHRKHVYAPSFPLPHSVPHRGREL